jgi:hypothetical protein
MTGGSKDESSARYKVDPAAKSTLYRVISYLHPTYISFWVVSLARKVTAGTLKKYVGQLALFCKDLGFSTRFTEEKDSKGAPLTWEGNPFKSDLVDEYLKDVTRKKIRLGAAPRK